MSSKNIVFVLNEYNGHGGAQKVASILADDFKMDGHHVSILSINEQANEDSYFSDQIPVHVVHKDNYRAKRPKELSSNLKGFRFNTVISELRRRMKLAKKQEEVERFFQAYGDEEVYVIVVQVWGMQWLEPLLYYPNIKLIGQSHESYLASKDSHRYKSILKYYRQVSKFLLLTAKDADYYESLGFTNVGMVYNPSPFRHQNKADALYSCQTVVSSGRLVEGKGFDVLIEAFALVAGDIPNWTLKILGDGPEKKNLQDLIHILGMDQRIELKGQTNQMQAELESASFFVLSSRAEGLPMSLIEAQSCGLPCISTDCAPGIREIVKEYKNGFVVPIDDIKMLSRQIKRLATDTELYQLFSEDAYNNSYMFSKDVIKNQWYEIFNEVGDQHDNK